MLLAVQHGNFTGERKREPIRDLQGKFRVRAAAHGEQDFFAIRQLSDACDEQITRRSFDQAVDGTAEQGRFRARAAFPGQDQQVGIFCGDALANALGQVMGNPHERLSVR